MPTLKNWVLAVSRAKSTIFNELVIRHKATRPIFSYYFTTDLEIKFLRLRLLGKPKYDNIDLIYTTTTIATLYQDNQSGQKYHCEKQKKNTVFRTVTMKLTK